MNFDAISKNAKISKIGLLEPKLWKIREIKVLKKFCQIIREKS